MATIRKPIAFGVPDTSGDAYYSTLAAQMTLTNAKRQQCMVMAFPTGADVTCETAFKIPENYAGSPVLVITMVLDGTPSGTLGFTSQQLSRAASETVDAAYEAEDTASNATWTGYADEEIFELSITLTPAAAYVAKDTILLLWGRDDSVDTTTFDVLVTDLEFEYSDT